MSNLIEFPPQRRPPTSVSVSTETPAVQEQPQAPLLGPEQRHQLEVRLDVARERVLLWRIAVVFAALVGLLLVRALVLS